MRNQFYLTSPGFLTQNIIYESVYHDLTNHQDSRKCYGVQEGRLVSIVESSAGSVPNEASMIVNCVKSNAVHIAEL